MIEAAPSGPHDNTALYLLAAIVIAAIAFGYLFWRGSRGTRRHDRTHSDADSSYDNGKGDFS